MKLSRRKLLSGTAALAGTTLARQSFSLASALAAASAAQLAADPRRPQYHLLPAANWMNDPNGPIFWRGQYHMFYQYNPHAAVAAEMHWGHAVSPDMVHWRHLPVALAPTPGGPDAAGCWTGTAVPDGDRVAVLYAGVASAPENEATIRDGAHSLRESQCLAFSSGDLTHWTKVPNPVIAAPPPGLDVTGFRDPVPWRQGDTWYCAVGSGIRGQGGAVLLYRSSDLYHWNYLHTLHHGDPTASSVADPVASGDMWECPDFFPLGDKYVLLYSTERKVYWEVGTFDKRDLRFHTETRGLLDHGSYYAMKSMVDEKGRRILWGWVQETRNPAECKAAGWAGAMALPRVLSLGPDNTLRMDVPPEFASLRTGTQKSIKDRAGEIICKFKVGHSACGLELRSGTTSLFDIHYEGGPSATIGGKAVPLSPDRDGLASVRLFVDGSIIETFVNNQEAVTTRCYTPSSADIHVVWTGAPDAFSRLDISGITPISKDRLTI